MRRARRSCELVGGLGERQHWADAGVLAFEQVEPFPLRARAEERCELRQVGVECALYLLFGLGAVLVALLPAWRGRAATLGIAFFVVVVAGLWLGWSLRDILRPADFDNSTYYRWIFLFSPAAISLQFGIGVAAWKVSTRIASVDHR